MAGESADEVARRARAKAERLLRHAELFEKGAAGERAVGALLDSLPPEWTVLHDVRWPGRERANVDHVLIGPTGIYVIDSKNWSGQITLHRGVLRQNGYHRTKAVAGASDAAAAIGSLVPSLDPHMFTPVICFAGDSAASGIVDGVLVCHVDNLSGVVTSRPRVLSPEWLTFLQFELDMSTRQAAASSGQVSRAARPLPPRRMAASKQPIARETPRPQRKSGALRRIAAGIILWWLGCLVVYYVAGPMVHYSPGFLGPAYIVLAVWVAARLARGPRRRTSRTG